MTGSPVMTEAYPVMQYFEYGHLPRGLRLIAGPIKLLAELMCDQLEDCAEKAAGMRKLLEAKDCFVRAGLQYRRGECGKDKN